MRGKSVSLTRIAWCHVDAMPPNGNPCSEGMSIRRRGSGWAVARVLVGEGEERQHEWARDGKPAMTAPPCLPPPSSRQTPCARRRILGGLPAPVRAVTWARRHDGPPCRDAVTRPTRASTRRRKGAPPRWAASPRRHNWACHRRRQIRIPAPDCPKP
jgi:hypothetical protein